ncbi:MAG: CYTH domain-containing protein [Gemmatimonadales bacterium]
MAREIERKFLVRRDRWRPNGTAGTGGTRYRQGYLSTDPARVVRVRTAGDAAFLTVKGTTVGTSRAEYEYRIPLEDADEMLDQLCLHPLIEKTRYREAFGGRPWEIDVFEGTNDGLVVAEIELSSAQSQFEEPPWLGAEVSGDPRYFNSNLVRAPFTSWTSRGDDGS